MAVLPMLPMSVQGLNALSPEIRLLIACCRLNPDAAVLADAVARVENWMQVVDSAKHHFIVPLVYRQLSGLPHGVVPVSALEALGVARKASVRKTLLQQAELQHLTAKHLAPHGIDYLVFKGLTLAGHYYGSASLRECRDIDVLIDPRRLHGLVADLLDNGYQLKLSAHPVRNAKDLRAYCEMVGDVAVLSPRGVLLELHQRLDFTGCQYPVKSELLFAKAEKVCVDAHEFPALPTTDLFIYLCYHHGKHQWSRLHWVADLDALIQHELFRLMAVLQRADELGLRSMVDAALHIYQVLHNVRLPVREMASPKFAQGVLDECLSFIDVNRVPPENLRLSLYETSVGTLKARAKIFSYNWRANTGWRNRLCYLLSITNATYADYLFLPLPRSLHFVYRVSRPLRWLLDSLHLRRVGTKH
jgi:hypothetical protein